VKTAIKVLNIAETKKTNYSQTVRQRTQSYDLPFKKFSKEGNNP
jgi:hypothetical protein